MTERDRDRSRKDASTSIGRRAFVHRASTAALFGAVGLDALFARSALGAVAAPSVTPTATAVTPLSAPAQVPTVNADAAALEIDGVYVGQVWNVSGGGLANVLTETQNGTSAPSKSVTNTRGAPVELTVSTGMSARFYDWVAGFLVGAQSPRTVALYSHTVRSAGRRIVLSRCSIVSVAVAPLAMPVAPPGVGTVQGQNLTTGPLGTIVVTIVPEIFAADAVISPPRPAWPNAIEWHVGGFQLLIQGYEASTNAALRVEGLGAKTAVVAASGTFKEAQLVPGLVETSNLRVTLPDSLVDPFYKWPAGAKVPGQIQFTAATGQSIGSIDLINLGVAQVTSVFETRPAEVAAGTHVVPPPLESTSNAIVELFCEQIRFNLGGFAVAA